MKRFWIVSGSTASLLFSASAFAQGEPTPPPPAYDAPATAEPAVPPEPTPAPPLPDPPPPEAESGYAPEVAEPVPEGVERHDGFYLRAALGAARLGMDRSSEGKLYGVSAGGDSSVTGVAGMFELSIGGTPLPGFVVAGSLISHQIAKPVLKRDGAHDADLGGPLSFVVLGPSVDWFPNPHKGFHVGGALGLGLAKAKAPNSAAFDNIGGAGGAFSIGVGYDWWVADDWSIGVLGRLSGARVHGEETHTVGGAELKGNEDSTMSAVGVLFSVLYH